MWKTLLLAWFLTILIVSFLPASELPKEEFIPYFDKIVHFGMYFILTILFMQTRFLSSSLIGFWVFCAVVLFLSSIVEILQEVLPISRHASLLDIIANMLGTLVAIGIYRTFKRR